jgi:hypothetical protein
MNAAGLEMRRFLRNMRGHQPRGHYLIHEDKRYPMKAVWAAAHRPTIQTRDFKTGAARRGLMALGFTKFLPEKNSR